MNKKVLEVIRLFYTEKLIMKKIRRSSTKRVKNKREDLFLKICVI